MPMVRLVTWFEEPMRHSYLSKSLKVSGRRRIDASFAISSSAALVHGELSQFAGLVDAARR